MDQDHDAVVAVTTESFSFVMQTSMSVMNPTDVMRMHSALTQWEASPAPAILVTLEVELPVQVSY